VMLPLSFSLGIVAGVREGSPADRIISFTSVVSTSVPEFASAVFLSAMFVFWLGVLPGASTMTSGFAWREVVLPVMVLVLYDFGYVARIVRAAMAEVMTQPYVRTALMKGASPTRIIFRHALRNALVAPITVVMLQIPWLLSGVIVVEVFFAYKGFGTLLYQACLNSDVALIEACAMVSVIVIVVTQFFSDLLYALLNPRIQLTAPRRAVA
jgi:ABC-type dipeptide/oligopeptide/nickel transport system permease component